MTRGGDDDVRRVREALADPAALCSALGLIPEGGRGRTWFADARDALRVPCPWHSERTGSCSVRRGPDGTVQVRCFACDASGDALSLVAVTHSLDLRTQFRDVLSTAAALGGVDLSAPYVSHAGTLRKAYVAPEPEPVDDGGAMDAIADVLRRVAPVDGQPDVAAYLDARGLLRAAAGWYALPSSAAELDTVRDMIVAAVGDAVWLASGLAVVDGPHAGRWTFAQHRLVIPWCAPNGAVTTLQRRPIVPLDGVGKYVFARDHRPVCPWGLYEASEAAGPDTAVAIVEGAIDAASFGVLCAMRGLDGCGVALPGAGAWRDAWAPWFARRDVFVALDGDAAGDRNAARITAALHTAGARNVERMKPLDGKDWNDALVAAIGGAS